MVRCTFSSKYANDDELMDELSEYFELSPHINSVLDYDSLMEYFKKYMDFHDVDSDIVDAIGERVLDTVNKNRSERGLLKLKSLKRMPFDGVPMKRIVVKRYFKRGTPVGSYEKSAPTRWSPAETKFVKTRIRLPLPELVLRFNERFPDRTKNSIMTKRSRLKG